MDLVDKIRAFNRFITVYSGSLNRHYMDSPYNVVEVRILYEIYERKSIRAKTLTELLQMDKGYISRLLSRLEKEQLVAKTVSKEDKRQFDIVLTSQGRATIEGLIATTNHNITASIQTLSQKEQADLYQALEKAERLLEKGVSHVHD